MKDDMATTQDWIVQAETIRAQMLAGGNAAPGVITREQMAQMSGLEIFKAILAGQLPYASVGKMLNYSLILAEPGEVVFQGSPPSEFLNPMGTVHGGWYGTLLDSAMGCAVHTTVAAGRGFTTAEYSVNIVRGAKLGGVYRTIGKVLHAGRQMATAEGRVVDADGKLYAHGTTTCFVFDMPKLVPADEQWLHTAETKDRLAASDAWMAAHPAKSSDIDKLAMTTGLATKSAL